MLTLMLIFVLIPNLNEQAIKYYVSIRKMRMSTVLPHFVLVQENIYIKTNGSGCDIIKMKKTCKQCPSKMA